MMINKTQAGTFRNLIVASCFFPPSHKNGSDHLTPHNLAQVLYRVFRDETIEEA